MKAISVWQPWASAWARGKIKKVETRSWPTKFRGDLVVCAAAKDDFETRRIWGYAHELQACCMSDGITYTSAPRGVALGVVELFDCQPVESLRGGLNPAELVMGDYSDERFAWIARRFRPFEIPFSVKGKQGLFDLSDELVNAALIGKAVVL